MCGVPHNDENASALNPPDGQINAPVERAVQPSSQKYSASRLTQISRISLIVPRPFEGRFAIVTNVGYGMRWTQMVPKTRALFADGEVAWS
jgi:hypothetical protein